MEYRSEYGDTIATNLGATPNVQPDVRLVREENQDDDDYEDDDAEGTAQMLREVARLNDYVKRYEQRKQMRQSVQDELSKKRDLSNSFVNASNVTAASSVQTSTGDDSKYSVPY